MANETEQSTESLVLNVWPDVGKALRLSKTTVWARVHDGTIPSIRIGGRYLVPKSALQALLCTVQQPPTNG